MALNLKPLGVNTVSEAIKRQSVNTQHFNTRNHLKVLGVNTLDAAIKTGSVNT